MFRKKKIPVLIPLTGYLCLFFCLYPFRAEGALLESGPAGGAEPSERAVVGRLEDLGLSRAEAEARVIAYRRAGLDFSGLTFRAGGDRRGVGQQKYNYDPPINTVVLVLLICGSVVAAGAAAGVAANK